MNLKNRQWTYIILHHPEFIMMINKNNNRIYQSLCPQNKITAIGQKNFKNLKIQTIGKIYTLNFNK